MKPLFFESIRHFGFSMDSYDGRWNQPARRGIHITLAGTIMSLARNFHSRHEERILEEDNHNRNERIDLAHSAIMAVFIAYDTLDKFDAQMNHSFFFSTWCPVFPCKTAVSASKASAAPSSSLVTYSPLCRLKYLEEMFRSRHF